ncbi:MAG: ABC transporter permease [Acidobacteriia bacterium]|nr:ABC transporter permease [Terriglobia bacterium]
METLAQDFKYNLRVLLKNPGFATVAVLVLALGIGANTAIFTVVNAVLLRPLPYPDANRLVRIWHVPPPQSFPGMTRFAVSAANYVDWEAQNHVFDRMTIYSYRPLNLTGTTQPEAIDVTSVSSQFFAVLGVQPMLGRAFIPEEDQPGRNRVVILSHRFWQSHLGGNPGIVGQNITLDNESYLVAGIMPANFRIPGYAQMWTPMAWTDKERSVRGEHHYTVVAHLRPGVSVKQAQAEMTTISSRLEQQYPEDDKGWGAVVLPLHEDIVRDVRAALLVLLGAVAFVLLIACANVTNLVLARTFGRRKEIAIRAALGASRARVLSQVLSETVLLAITGGLVGLVVAHFGVRLILAFLANQIPQSAEVGLNSWVLGFALAVSLLSGVLAGLLPALRLFGIDLNETLKQGSGRTDADSLGKRTRSALVISEVALSLVLLFGAGLLVRSLLQLRQVDGGFDPHHVLTMLLSIPETKFPTPGQEVSFFDQVLEKVRNSPGVEAAAAIDDLPLGGGSHQPIAVEGRPKVPMSEQPEVDVRLATPGYMRTMRIPVLRGREFNDTDVAERPAVVVISESMARSLWPNEDAIGKRLTLTFFPDTPREVVGIVGDVKMDGLDQSRPEATLYWPLAQVSAPTMASWRSYGLSLVVRTTPDPASLVSAVTDAVHGVDKDIPVLNIQSMDDLVSTSLSPQRLNVLLLGVFAGLALLLAAIGIYSVLSYNVRRRVREIGIRMALGAQIQDVLRMVIIEGMRPTLIGLGIGLAGALLLGRFLSSLIFGVKATDPLTFGAVSVLLAGVALIATVIPAYRATRVQPMRALRDE